MVSESVVYRIIKPACKTSSDAEVTLVAEEKLSKCTARIALSSTYSEDSAKKVDDVLLVPKVRMTTANTAYYNEPSNYIVSNLRCY